MLTCVVVGPMQFEHFGFATPPTFKCNGGRERDVAFKPDSVEPAHSLIIYILCPDPGRLAFEGEEVLMPLEDQEELLESTRVHVRHR